MQGLLDREAIRELKARYCRLLDQQKWAEWRQLFTDDAAFETKVPAVGVDAWVEAAARHLHSVRTAHHVHVPEIVLTVPDAARGIWAMFDDVEDLTTGGRKQGYGHYEEEYRRVDRGWRISFLRLTRIRVDHLNDAPMFTAERQDE